MSVASGEWHQGAVATLIAAIDDYLARFQQPGVADVRAGIARWRSGPIKPIPRSVLPACDHLDPALDALVAEERSQRLDRVGNASQELAGMTLEELGSLGPMLPHLCEVAYETLERSCVRFDRLRMLRVGTFVGVSDPQWLTVRDASFLADLLGLPGPATTVIEAGAGPLLAVHLAAEAVRAGDIDLALVAGDLAHVEDHFVTLSGRRVKLGIYVTHGNEDKVAFAMGALKRSMKWDEDAFGREYDLDIFNIVAVSAFNFGAMENKGLNIFNDKLILARPDTATDTDYDLIEAVVGHEYFHNWSGNRITCRDWFQLSLKEGFTVFRDQSFSADMRSAAVERIGDVRALRMRQFQEDGGPLAHPVRPDSYLTIDNFYTATVYEKGAELCRMVRTILGAEAFRKGHLNGAGAAEAR